MDGLTRQLATFIAHLTTEQCPSDAVATAKRGAIDTIGVMLAGRDEPVVGHARSIARSIGVVSESQVLFDRGRAASSDAALVNGTAGHALDYDDVAIDGHPSVVLVPAMLAEGERLGASGDALLTAYIAGYETWGELAGRDADKHHGKGWHPTAVFGTIGAAAAAASLARLDVDRTVNALGIAASMASGLVANFGSMTKPFHAGRAAANGILAAQLAAAGMTASPDALEHRSGFLKALSPHGRMRVDGPISAIRCAMRCIGRSMQRSSWSSVTSSPPMTSAASRFILVGIRSICSAIVALNRGLTPSSARSLRWPRPSSRAASA